jgi:hypothetical protein
MVGAAALPPGYELRRGTKKSGVPVKQGKNEKGV